jgi:hypothetical protein
VSTDMCSVYRHVQCLQTCAVSTDMCSVYRHVQCLQTCVVSTDMCSVYRHVQCLQTCAVSTYMCSVYRNVQCLQTCAVSTDNFVFPRFLYPLMDPRIYSDGWCPRQHGVVPPPTWGGGPANIQTLTTQSAVSHFILSLSVQFVIS